LTHIDILNRRLAESLGRVCSGTFPRYKWFYAPSMPHFVYDSDDRTLLKRCWADAPGPDGNPIGRVWVLAEWRRSRAFDHHGFGEGMRVPFVREFDYAPYFETAIAPGQLPTAELNQNYIFALDFQLSRSAEIRGDHSMDGWLAEERYTADRNGKIARNEHIESSAAEYDKHTGAFGNLQPGQIDGWMSWGGIKDTPLADASPAS